jgi:aspartyl-tRNA(Asn)/glutamyl-tRNA(Gln) amidotransferase subunit B
MRSKEDAQDYRYFPDPDLPPLSIDEKWIERIRADLPELPEVMRSRLMREYALPAADAALLISQREMASYFERLVAAGADPRLAGNWLLGEMSAALNRAEIDIADAPVSSTLLVGMLRRIADGTISGKLAKEVFEAMWAGEGDADAIIDARGLKQISDVGAIEKIVADVLAANAAIVAEYKAGKDKAFQSLVGKVMAASRGKANPIEVNAALKKMLG